MDGSVSEKKTRRQKKKKAIEISLWIDGVKYDYGIMCTFCTKSPAIFHCSECTDFYCGACDSTAHSTKKRKGHVRSKISKYDLNTAARKLTYAVRFRGHLRLLQKLCRLRIRRFFDKKTLNHYYYNTVYGTVSWKKPYCLRKEELCPFVDKHTAICRIQGIYHCWKAREAARASLVESFTKIFDRRRGLFYYAYHGKSTLLPRSSWKKPKYCGKRSYPKDILPIYTVDIAALIIQRKWRAILVRELFRALARINYQQIWDPVKGQWNYYYPSKGIMREKMPVVMRGQPWDVNYIPEWTPERVSLFLRRIGLKRYVKAFSDYGVDGRALLLLDAEDFDNMNISSKIHIKKILVETEKLYRAERKGRISEEHEARRERIRKAKMFNIAAIRIQTRFRGFIARKELALLREMKKIADGEKKILRAIAREGRWWTLRSEIPSLNWKPQKGIILQVQSHEDYEPQPLYLPPLKEFGRKRDHATVRGWGHRDSHCMDSFCPVSLPTAPSSLTKVNINNSTVNFHQQSSSNGNGNGNGNGNANSKDKKTAISMGPSYSSDSNEIFLGDSHPSRLYTDKLISRGYDRRRFQKFRGLPVDPYNPKVDLKRGKKAKKKKIGFTQGNEENSDDEDSEEGNSDEDEVLL